MRKSGPSAPPASTIVDEEWYLSQYPDVEDGIKLRRFRSAQHHFMTFGYSEGRVPSNPKVDEAWYLETNPDVAEAVKSGRFKSAYDHFMKNGYREGRKPNPNGI